MENFTDNWLEDYFKSGFYEAYWGWQLEEEDPKELAKNALEMLGAKHGHILDWCGGWGRVSIHFAKQGFHVTILDLVPEYLEKAKDSFHRWGLEVKTVFADCRETPHYIQADYATVFFNTVGFFDDNEQVRAFKSLHKALKPGAKVLLDCMNLFFLADKLNPEYDTPRQDGYLFRQNNRFDFDTNTLHSLFQIIDQDGKVDDEKVFQQRLYTPMDIKRLMELAGFKVEDMFSGYNFLPVAFDQPKLIVLAEK